MKIFFIDLKYDYGDPARGINNIGEYGFRQSFLRLGHDVHMFYYDEYLKNTNALQSKVLEAADQCSPDLIFVGLFQDQFLPSTLDQLKAKYTTVNWFGDDTWRFDKFTKKFAPHFTYCLTTDKFSLPKYRALGINKVIYTQWAAIPYESKTDKTEDEPDRDYQYDVSFVGQANPFRKWFIAQLAKKGIQVNTFGKGWGGTPVSMEEMINVIKTSKINLNLSNSKSFDYRYLFSGLKNFVHTFYTSKVAAQVKARNFEIPYYGGFQMTDFTPGLEDYFHIGRDLVCYKDVDEAALLIDYYLKNDEEREVIKQSGIEVTKNGHTFYHRIKEFLQHIQQDTV